MISNLFKSLRLTIAFCLFFSVFYIFVLWLFAQVAGPNKGNAELVTLNGKVLETPFFSHADLTKGGKLVFEMTNTHP